MRNFKSSSIVIFGNTNNLPLMFARGFQELGHNVKLIVNRREILHRPEGVYPQWKDAYPDWIFDCSSMSDEDIAYQTPAIDQAVRHLTHNVDLVILNDNGLALAGHLRCPHVALLTGSDLSYFANFDMLRWRSAGWDAEFKRSPQGRRHLAKFADFVARQRDGIASAELVWSSHPDLVSNHTMMLQDLGVLSHRCLATHFANTIDLSPQPLPQNERLTILNGARIVYRPEMHPDMDTLDFKGTDVLLEGFAKYIKTGGQGELRMVHKGQDIDAALALISELDIARNVKWLDEMTLLQFYREIELADLVCDQFVSASIPGAVTFDAYAMGRPVLANLRNDDMIRIGRFPEPLPGFDASTPDQVAASLHTAEGNRNMLVKMGEASRAFAEAYLSPLAPAKKCLEILGIK